MHVHRLATMRYEWLIDSKGQKALSFFEFGLHRLRIFRLHHVLSMETPICCLADWHTRSSQPHLFPFLRSRPSRKRLANDPEASLCWKVLFRDVIYEKFNGCCCKISKDLAEARIGSNENKSRSKKGDFNDDIIKLRDLDTRPGSKNHCR